MPRLTPALLLAPLLAGALAITACSKPSDTVAVPQKPSAPVPAVPPPAGKVWTDVVSTTPEGGTVIGNPSAPVKIVEYAAFTCPHCKRFEAEGAPKLLGQYVPSGRVSWEFRPLIIHGGSDAAATLLVACRGPGPYFTLAQQFFAAQDNYLNPLIALPGDEQQRIAALPPAEQFKEWARIGGLYAFFGARGLPKAQVDACLSDRKALDALTTAQQTATTLGVNSTPTFILNGRLLDKVSTWDTLEPELKALLG